MSKSIFFALTKFLKKTPSDPIWGYWDKWTESNTPTATMHFALFIYLQMNSYASDLKDAIITSLFPIPL